MPVILEHARLGVLYDLDVTGQVPDGCQVVAWNPAVPGISEVFHAHIVDYQYPTHCHDTWTVLIVDSGSIRYDLDSRHWGAAGDTVTILPPGVAHNGHPGDGYDGFWKRNLYLDHDFLPSNLVGRAVEVSNFSDDQLRTAISQLHDSLIGPSDIFENENRLAMIGERIKGRLSNRATPCPKPERTVAQRLREYLDGHITEKITLTQAAKLLDRSAPHLVRSFKREFGISPHAYVIGARIEQARRRLLQGQPPAQVACEVGFYDQSHLTRHFKQHVSTPPARYAASGINLTKHESPTSLNRPRPVQGRANDR